MAQSMRDIKRRIRSVENTKQITKAMEMVAASKLRKARERAEKSRPYFEELIETVGEIMKITGKTTNPLLKVREGDRKAFIVITADRGLSGGYNSNVIRKAVDTIENQESTSVIALGSKGRDYFKIRNYSVIDEYIGISESPEISYAKEIGQKIMKLFREEKIDQVYLVYTKFVSTLTQEPQIQKLLPISYEIKEEQQENNNEKKKPKAVMDYEPSAEAVLDKLLPEYIQNTIYGAMVESAASEQASRKVAMESATDNANDIIDDLSLTYNRARQGAITQELSEIVGSAEALK